MKKLQISLICSLVVLMLLLFEVFNLKTAYKDEVDVYQTAIHVDRGLSAKDRTIASSKTQQVAREINNEIKIVEILIWLISIFIVVVGVFYLRALIKHKRQGLPD